MRQGKTHAGG
jgi:hypothetical protein